MKINRENYEAFLLDKQENNLTKEQEHELEVFFQENTDLIPEKEDCVLDFRLENFPQDVLPNKEELLKKDNTLSVFLKYGAAVVVLLFVCTYVIVNYNTDNNKTNSLTKTINIKVATPKSNIENIDIQSQTPQSVVKNISTKENEKVFDTLFLERENEDAKDEERTLENKLYYEYIAIDYSDNPNEDNIIKTNKILIYEKDN